MLSAQNTHRFLTDEELQSFDRDGFLVVRGMYSPADIASVSRWVDELVARPPRKGEIMTY